MSALTFKMILSFFSLRVVKETFFR